MAIETTDTTPGFLQADIFKPYTEKLITGYTTKPTSFGGLESPENKPEAIAENKQALKKLITQQTNRTVENWVFPNQVHGDAFKIVDTTPTDFSPSCDAVIVTHPGQLISVGTADCVPLILYAPEAHAGAVIHAGWRGTAENITTKTVQAFLSFTQADPTECLAFIGPAITMKNYQVTTEVADALSDAVRLTCPQLIEIGWMQADGDGHCKVDLKALNMLQLLQQGIKQIELSPFCTWDNNDQFFSRRKGDPQNQISFLMLL